MNLNSAVGNPTQFCQTTNINSKEKKKKERGTKRIQIKRKISKNKVRGRA